MKKRILSILLVLVMAVGLLPATALAAADDNQIKLELVKDTTTFSGKDVLRVDFYAKSGTDVPNSHMVYLKIDTTKLDILNANSGNAAKDTLLNNFSNSNDEALTKNNYSFYDSDAEVTKKSEIKLYALKKDDSLYLCWKVTEPNNTSAFTNFTRISSIFFGLKEGTSLDALPKDVIAYSDPKVDEAVTHASVAAEININGGGGDNTLVYLPKSGSTGNMTAAPAFAAGAGVTFAEPSKPALQGSVTITGTPKIGQTLTADTTGITSTAPGTLSYKWYRDSSEISGATGSTYTPNDAADVGKTIKVEVTAANCSGSLSAATATAVAKKDGPSAPGAPTLSSKTSDSITVTKTDGQQYACMFDSSTPAEGDWKDTAVFDGLTSNTAYKIYTRIKATDTQEASEASTALDVTTDGAAGSIMISEPDTITYDGSAVEVGSGKDLNYTYTGDGTVTVKWYKDNSGSKGDELTGSAPKDAGTYWIGVSAAEGSSSAAVAEVTKKFTISPKNISGAIITLGTVPTYDGTEKQATISSVTVGGLTLTTSDYDISTGTDKTTNVESKELKITGKGNYTGEAIHSWKLQQATPVADDFTISTELTKDYTGNSISVTKPTLKSPKTGTGEITVKYNGSITAPTNAGSYTVTFDVAAGQNYKAATGLSIGTLQINKLTWTSITANGSAKYGTTGSVDLSSYLAAGGSFGAVTKTDSDNVLSGDPTMDGSTLKFTFVNEAGKAGKEATIKIPVTGATNYNDYEITVTVTVNDKTTPTVTAPTAKTGLVYNGADQVLIDAGATTGGTLQYSLTSGSGYNTELPKAKNAGNYTVYYKVIGNDDYADVAENSISVSVAKRTISVKADNKSMTVNGTLPTFTVTYGNLPSGVQAADIFGTLASASTTTDGKTTGSFDITATTPVLKTETEANYEVGAVTKGTLTVNPRSSSSGSGSSRYAITVADSKNGTVTVSSKTASKGDTVTVTVTPDKGYVLETLTALDKNGKELKLTEKNGKYTFTMPAGKVEVKATFMDDDTMLNHFVDVKAGDYFYDAVLWAVKNGVTSGTDATHFSPNAACTRGQIVTFLWRAAGSPEPKGTGSFTDVSADAYYAKAVVWAVEKGVTSGTGDGKFSPDATCTREQAVTFLYRALGSPTASGSSAFTDVAADAYYANAVAWAEKNGVTGGIGGGLFGSGSDCTRGQIVTFLYRAYQGK